MDVTITTLNELEWRVLAALKREFEPEELVPNLWDARAREAGVPLETFFASGRGFQRPQDHRPLLDVPGTRQAVARRRARDALQRALSLGGAAGPRDRGGPRGGPAPHHDARLLARGRPGVPQREHHGRRPRHRQAGAARPQGRHRPASAEAGIPVAYTNVFWGGRSEIKPSEISPFAYRDWCQGVGIDPEDMRA